MRKPAVRLLPLALVVPLMGVARADVTTTQDPLDLASAISSDPSLVASATFEMRPAESRHAVSSDAVQSFPTAGEDYAILSTWSAASSTLPGDEPDWGTTAYDVSVLRIDLDVAPSANCLAFDFRFLTNENPGWTEPFFEDAFVAELNSRTWTTTAHGLWDPDNFAAYPSGHPVDARSGSRMTGNHTAGTGYRRGSALLVATSAVSEGDANGTLPGNNSLYLSIFDDDDRQEDAAVYVDGLRAFEAAPGGCVSGPRTFTALSATPRFVEDTTVHLGELTARLSDRNGNGIAAKPVHFDLVFGGGSKERVCSTTTDTAGDARCADLDPTRGAGRAYEVRFEGDSIARPSRAWGSGVTIAGRRLL